MIRPYPVIALVVVSCGVSAQSAPTEGTFETTSGKYLVIGLFPAVKDDCSRGPLPEISFVQRPKGEVVAQRVRLGIPKTYKCEAMEVTAQRILYHAPFGFTGEEVFAYTVKDSMGRARTYSAKIKVKPFPQPDRRPEPSQGTDL